MYNDAPAAAAMSRRPRLPAPGKGRSVIAVSPSSLVYERSAEHRALDLDREPFIAWDRERIALEHDQIRKLPGLDRAFVVLFERCVSAVDGRCAQSLLQRDPLALAPYVTGGIAPR